MELYLIRHTTPDVPKGTCYGRMDVPLLSNHRSEFDSVFEKFENVPEKIYTSPSSRCKLLAEFLIEKSPKSTLEYSNSLMELNFGTWEGKLWSSISEEESGFWTKDFVNERTPGGESYFEMFGRVSEFLDGILKSNEDGKIGIVTHAGVIRIVLCKLLEIPLERAFSFELNYGSLNKIQIQKNGTEFFSKLIFWNL
ncbi:alpha-ribazole phosphatase [Leptospira kmetyi]|uniref:alpha-ribazole phosphatase n=1 Tax=Leptospira kmetyi TaxID=408139 RepID=UPI0002892980|nr:alpha-ribazole phosphatase [Leptospira kmetyi]EQA52275.1 alpha-ribazole phosphatase [Leptospira kmetyi serovar Malaysia str. Bejo-Iso9]